MAAPVKDPASPIDGITGCRALYGLVISNFADSKSFPFFLFQGWIA